MKLLLHTCCGPCSIYTIEELQKEYSLSVFFFNPNIHPFQEYKKRRNSLREYCESNNISVFNLGEYGLNEFLQKVIGGESERCTICYSWRLAETAEKAAQNGFDAFSTTLLYSRYQNHENIKKYGFELAEKFGISFVYKDFRQGWQYGIDKSIALGMYRQPYCGCIFSEQERYDKKLRKKTNK